eukprot:Gregarina_sp_Pseudo_9__2690@NODE_2935_length_812_cov_228_085382_g2681_i0_p1_GENE_NODE_2935_length_812_cov_228_085382_g2681_i0NODE_2935_length_812_cov_228_085382_g2681_i0_p1_ORF_typecomplete_len149_score46_49Histone/PF00125_24/2_9e14TFIID18kDa/PF02269_16/0_016TFIID18kDa/PF02269_16/17TFIID_20kDa/PF03847_13/0_039CBFD_NFYB_HMF/PF00808_23/1_7e04CBFD_NFYB_HMF/PF00808_23/0_1CENPT_C/PF15511_6/4_7CENPT_C/PF15511_6/82_NODE_2935_length_812_cov_228_085382_g2681_i099545
MVKSSGAGKGAGKSVPAQKSVKSKGGKRIGKTTAGGEEEEKKRKVKDVKAINFHSVIFRVFKQVREDNPIKISKDTVHVLNTIIHDLVQRLGEEAGRLCKYTHHDTMKLRDMQTAVRLGINTRELSSLMCAAGDDAVKKFFQNTMDSK